MFDSTFPGREHNHLIHLQREHECAEELFFKYSAPPTLNAHTLTQNVIA